MRCECPNLHILMSSSDFCPENPFKGMSRAAFRTVYVRPLVCAWGVVSIQKLPVCTFPSLSLVRIRAFRSGPIIILRRLLSS